MEMVPPCVLQGLELESRLGRANVASLFDLYRWLWVMPEE